MLIFTFLMSKQFFTDERYGISPGLSVSSAAQRCLVPSSISSLFASERLLLGLSDQSGITVIDAVVNEVVIVHREDGD